ncbi:cell division protein ZipA C-terminal FtsZ-binding domain-containing protein [Methylobacillus flagellatus]|uniref:cell division protein ZipA C-terminal FtsZ-binding domain-containing protein n=1 Tax=Methylobacillus flagellatus TaxID=405 RepID=UPI0010FA2748|nr:cell division protein ZipA C-terminal FtsZ-binding domain-containing protein [Methylobacillus flagellatus]
MTDLHLALIAIGILLIVAVIAYNSWQERQLRRQANSLTTPEIDPLMEAGPTLRQREFEQAVPLAGLSDVHEPLSARDDALGDADFEEYVSEPVKRGSKVATPAQPVEVPELSELPAELESELPAEPAMSAAHTVKPDVKPDAELVPKPTSGPVAASRLASGSAFHPAAQPAAEPESQALEPQALATPALKPSTDITAPEPLPAGIDPRIDLIAQLQFASMDAQQLQDFMQQLTDIEKPLLVYGRGRNTDWQLLHRDTRAEGLQQLACALQLADRSGVISTALLQRFQLLINSLSNSLDAKLQWLPAVANEAGHAEIMHHAQALDAFCVEVDQMISLHLVPSSTLLGSKLRGLAEASGLSLQADGKFHWQDAAGQTQFLLQSESGTPFDNETMRTIIVRGLLLKLDIPHVSDSLEVFNRMILLARQMETALGAHLVDDQQRPLSEAQIDKIRVQLKALHNRMLARGITPGSALAHRLFS